MVLLRESYSHEGLFESGLYAPKLSIISLQWKNNLALG